MSLKKYCSKLLILSIILSGLHTQSVSAQFNEEKLNKQSSEISVKSELNNTLLDLQENIFDNGFKFKENENLSLEEIKQRMLEIDAKYEVNEILSKSDSEFIIGYHDILSKLIGNQNQLSKRAINKNASIKTVKKTVDGVTAQLSGSIKHSGGTTNMNNSFGGTLYFKILGGASKVKSVTGTIYHSGYGLLGSDGVIGKVYSGEITETWTSAPFASKSFNNRTKNYSALIVLMSTHAEMVVKTNNTTFDLQGGI